MTWRDVLASVVLVVPMIVFAGVSAAAGVTAYRALRKVRNERRKAEADRIAEVKARDDKWQERKRLLREAKRAKVARQVRSAL